jgi:uncharacterized damage-inducible protein DinB
MTQLQAFQKELENESVATRKMLSIIPADKLDWQPHPKSMTVRNLAAHIAELPLWVGMALNTDGLDFAANPYEPFQYTSTTELLEYFEKNLADGKAQIASAKEDKLDDTWVLRNGEQVYWTDKKREIIRTSLSQIIHHRAQLGVFLRLLDVPIPGTYGPSADDVQF